MKTIYLVYMMSLLILGACSEKSDFPELIMESDVLAVTIGESAEIQIISGSGDYSVKNEDITVVSSILQNSHSAIFVSGLKIGETILFMKDNKSLQEKQIRVKVISANEYMSLKILDSSLSINPNIDEISSDIQDNSIFAVGNFITLFSGQSKAYIFKDEESLKRGIILNEGTYQLKEDDDSRTIEFVFDGDTHSYSMSIQCYYHLFVFLTTPVHSPPNDPYLVVLHNELTDSYTGTFPDLEVASLSYKTMCRSLFALKIPSKLFFETEP